MATPNDTTTDTGGVSRETAWEVHSELEQILDDLAATGDLLSVAAGSGDRDIESGTLLQIGSMIEGRAKDAAVLADRLERMIPRTEGSAPRPVDVFHALRSLRDSDSRDVEYCFVAFQIADPEAQREALALLDRGKPLHTVRAFLSLRRDGTVRLADRDTDRAGELEEG